MAITFARAVEIVERELQAMSCEDLELQLLPQHTKEFDVGWLFHYQSARFIATGDMHEMLAGNAPMLVSRSDGSHYSVGYHRPIEESIRAYRACGDPNAKEISQVRLVRSDFNAQTVPAIRAIRRHTDMGLAQAKSVIDSCLTQECPQVQLASVPDARRLVEELRLLGFHAELCYLP